MPPVVVPLRVPGNWHDVARHDGAAVLRAHNRYLLRYVEHRLGLEPPA